MKNNKLSNDELVKVIKTDIEKIYICFKCGSKKIGKRFSRRGFDVTDNITMKKVNMDSDDYKVYYGCLMCFDCKAWDFPETFIYYNMTSNGYEVCPNCGENGFTSLYSYDYYCPSNSQLKCNHCNKINRINKFFPKGIFEKYLERLEIEKNINSDGI